MPMPSYSFLRPKTSSGLPTQHNDSTIYSTSTTQLPAHKHSLSQHQLTRRKTQEFIARPSFSTLTETTVATRTSNGHLLLSSYRKRDREIEPQSTIRKGVDSAAAMVRKALQGSRDMRPIDKLTPIHPHEMYNPSTSPSSNTRSRDRDRSREWPPQEVAMTRPMSRLRSSIRRRRNAVSARSGKTHAPLPTPPTTPESMRAMVAPPMPVHPGSAARASAAEHNKSQLSQLQRSDTKVIRSKPQAHNMDALMVDEVTDQVHTGQDNKKFDPCVVLPAELAMLILASLDQQALGRALCVSKSWNSLASENTVWRAFYLKKYSRAPNNVIPYIRMGGEGLGTGPYTAQQWRKMAIARNQIELNWKQQKPRAIYFAGHTDSVYCCQYDEDKIITGSRDRTVRVWNLNAPYECIKVIGGPAVRPTLPAHDSALDVHPRNVYAGKNVNGTAEGNAIFHVPTLFHSASILCLQFDHEIMVTGSSDSTCIVWDIRTYEAKYHLIKHSAGVLDVCFDDEFIVSCSKDTTICVWSRKDGSCMGQLYGHKGPVNAVQLREIGGKKLLVSASGDSCSKMWDLREMKQVKQFDSKDRGLAAVEFSDDGKHVLAGGNDQVIYKYDAETTDLVDIFKGHTNLVRSLFLDSANARVLSGSYDQGIRVYDFNDGSPLGVYDNWTTSWILAAKSDYRRIVATSQDGRALLMDFGYKVKDVELLRGS